MKKNVASQNIGVQMITAADGTNFTGTVTVVITIDSGTQSASGGTAPAHEGNGYHSYTPTQAETNGDHLAFTFTGSGAITATVQTYTTFPQTVDNDVLAAGATGFTAIDTVVDAILVDTNELQTDWTNGGRLDLLLDAIPTTAMRGTDSAALATAMTTAQNDLDIITGASGVNLLTATQASIDAIEADTNELQTDWADGGRLDLLLDAIPTTAMRGTDSAALASVCTEARLAELDAGNIPSDLDAVLVDTGTTIPGLLGTPAADVSADIAAVKVDTAATLADTVLLSSVFAVGAAITGTLSITQMSTNLTEATDDHYNGRLITWTSGVLKDQQTDITDYTGSTKVLTYTATTDAPSNTDTFVIT